MATHRIRARSPRGAPRRPRCLTGADTAAHVQDAAHTPGGHTPLVAFPRSEAEVAWVLREAPAVLPVGAQSSLTGGGTPFGEWVLSLADLAEMAEPAGDSVRVQAGVTLAALEHALAERRAWFPPVPTFRGACVGGALATNAAGAATFKYGSMRRWVRALTVVLADGRVLDVSRGACQAHADGYFEIEAADGAVRRVPLPAYRMPDVPKRSAGYHVEPQMDLVDLFVGSEGTLGVITEAELQVDATPARLLAWVAFGDETHALACAARLREAALACRAGEPAGLDVAAIESLDRRSLSLLREDAAGEAHGFPIAAGWDAALLLQIELPAGEAGDQAATRAVERLAALLEGGPDAESLRLVLPGETRRAEALLALREAVPEAVNRRVAEAQRSDPGVHKVAADMIVPFAELPAMMACYREGFRRRGLDHALWGHASDGNIHANALPRTREDVRLGLEAVLEFGDQAIRRGGCPLSEHGVGRSPVKQELLRRLYGAGGIDQMRRVKNALDPDSKLAPGVLFPVTGPHRYGSKV